MKNISRLIVRSLSCLMSALILFSNIDLNGINTVKASSNTDFVYSSIGVVANSKEEAIQLVKENPDYYFAFKNTNTPQVGSLVMNYGAMVDNSSWPYDTPYSADCLNSGYWANYFNENSSKLEFESSEGISGWCHHYSGFVSIGLPLDVLAYFVNDMKATGSTSRYGMLFTYSKPEVSADEVSINSLSRTLAQGGYWGDNNVVIPGSFFIEDYDLYLFASANGWDTRLCGIDPLDDGDAKWDIKSTMRITPWFFKEFAVFYEGNGYAPKTYPDINYDTYKFKYDNEVYYTGLLTNSICNVIKDANNKYLNYTANYVSDENKVSADGGFRPGVLNVSGKEYDEGQPGGYRIIDGTRSYNPGRVIIDHFKDSNGNSYFGGNNNLYFRYSTIGSYDWWSDNSDWRVTGRNRGWVNPAGAEYSINPILVRDTRNTNCPEHSVCYNHAHLNSFPVFCPFNWGAYGKNTDAENSHGSAHSTIESWKHPATLYEVKVYAKKNVILSYLPNPLAGHTVSGVMDDVVADNGSNVTVNGSNYSDGSATFLYWNTKADGSGTTYKPGDTIYNIGEDMSLYAIWAPDRVISYACNPLIGHTVTGSVPNTVVKYGNTGVVNNNGFSDPSATFLHWNTKPDGSGTSYEPGSSISYTSGDMVLYAIWAPDHYITYNGNGSTGSVPTQTKKYGIPITISSNSSPGFVKEGYNYVGWNTSPDGTGTTYLEGTAYIAEDDLVLYAQWVPINYDVVVHPNKPNNSSSNMQTVK